MSLTPASLASYYVKLETDAYRALAAKDRALLFLPVRAAECKVPALMAGIKWIDAVTLGFDAAIDALARALRASDGPSPAAAQAESADLHIMRADDQGGQVRNERAVADLATCEEMLARYPNDTLTWRRKGDALYLLARYEDAVDAYERASPKDPLAWAKMGRALYCLKRYEEALAACEQALERYPKNTTALRWKVKALRSLGRDAEADEAEQQARELGLKGD